MKSRTNSTRDPKKDEFFPQIKLKKLVPLPPLPLPLLLPLLLLLLSCAIGCKLPLIRIVASNDDDDDDDSS